MSGRISIIEPHRPSPKKRKNATRSPHPRATAPLVKANGGARQRVRGREIECTRHRYSPMPRESGWKSRRRSPSSLPVRGGASSQTPPAVHTYVMCSEPFLGEPNVNGFANPMGHRTQTNSNQNPRSRDFDEAADQKSQAIRLTNLKYECARNRTGDQ